MTTEYNNNQQNIYLVPHSTYIVDKDVWHQATNVGTEPVHVIEIQYGEKCEESDIERRHIY